MRKTYFPFVDEEKEVWKRKAFKDYEKNIYDMHFLDAHRDDVYGDKFFWDYIGVNFMNILFNVFLAVFISISLFTNMKQLFPSIIPLVIFMHLTLFPDYINKLLPNDIRTRKGFRVYYAIWSFFMLFPLIFLKLLTP